MKRFLISIFLILLASGWAFAQRFPVKVVGISDGDSFTVINRDNLQINVRVFAIDAPEKNQAYGDLAKKALSDLIYGKDIEIDVQAQERWGRYVAKVHTPEGRDVALLMLQSGMAWHYTRYNNSTAYIKAQEAAKNSRRGLWADKNPVAPWDYRKKH